MINDKKVLGLILARGGSKRLPGKNVKDLCGKPLIAWTIEAALKSQIFDDVLVSTDSDEIASISKEHGATVPFFRKPELADDYTPVSSATLDSLLQMENFKKFNYENSADHIKEHDLFREKIAEWAAKCPSANNRLPILKDAADFISVWFINHILVSDKQYTKCFNEHGLT